MQTLIYMNLKCSFYWAVGPGYLKGKSIKF